MKQKTAIDLLVDALDQSINSHSELKSEHSLAKLNALKAVKRYALYLKKTEREQIEEAYFKGYNDCDNAGEEERFLLDVGEFSGASDYYQQKYGDEK